MSPRAAAPRRLEYMLVAELAPADRNPKAHDLATLQASIDRFGFVEPVVLDERTERLVSGHGRTEVLAAAEAAGLDAPEGIKASRGGWAIPVIRGWASADDDEAEAYIITANAVGEGLWERDLLAEMLAAVAESPAGLTGTGFDDHYLADLLASLAPPPSLDDLSDEHGDPDSSDFWPVLRGKVSPDLHERFLAATEPAGNELADQLTWLLDLAESADGA